MRDLVRLRFQRGRKIPTHPWRQILHVAANCRILREPAGTKAGRGG